MDVLGYSEGTSKLGQNGHNILIGGTTFDSYADRRNEELFDEGLRKFEETVFGYSRDPDNFYDNY